MLALVSPAKKLDFSEMAAPIFHSQPDFLEQSAVLVEQAKKLSQVELSRLMKLSDKLTDLNFQRFKAYSPPFTKLNAKQAALAFNGDTYVGLDAPSLSEGDLIYAQEILKTKQRLNEIYVEHTGQDIETIQKNMERDKFFTSEEALEFGLIDKIIDKRPE